MKNRVTIVFLSIITFFVGAFAGLFGVTYLKLPHNEELVHTGGGFFSKSSSENTVNIAKDVQKPEAGAISVHFLELGNKYTGDCTYIKVGTDIDILIDCGSKSTSVSTVSDYLD